MEILIGFIAYNGGLDKSEESDEQIEWSSIRF